MTNTLPGTRFGVLMAWPDPTTPGRWRYLPLAPSPQRNEAGRASLTVLEAGETLILTVGAELAASVTELAAAGAAIAKETGAAVELRVADVTVRAAHLLLTDADGAEALIAAAGPSTLPPYGGVFSAMLQGDAGRAVKAALSGGTGKMSVRYDVILGQTRSVTASVKGRWSGTGPIDAALHAGAVTLAVRADDGASQALIASVVGRVKAQARDMAARLAAPPVVAALRHETASLDTTATDMETVALPITLQGDLTAWTN